jgi:hypothetical protein
MAKFVRRKRTFFYQPYILHGAAGADRMQFIFCAGCS